MRPEVALHHGHHHLEAGHDAVAVAEAFRRVLADLLVHSRVAPGSAEPSGILDFSSQVIPGNCANGVCAVTITVHRPNYDYWLLNFGLYDTVVARET